MQRMHLTALVAALGALCAWARPVEAGRDGPVRIPVPPGQQEVGPGSTDYAHDRAIQLRYGRDAKGYYVIQPTDPRPHRAPVVVFVHGYSVTNPRNYAGWITHLVRRGNVVIYPIYQSGYSALNEDFAENTVAAVVDAYARLRGARQVEPAGDDLFIVGHSLGAPIAMYLAGEAEKRGLPRPRAVLLANAGEAQFDSTRLLDRIDYPSVPSDMLLLAVIGEEDRLVTSSATIILLERTPQIPPENKALLGLTSDDHGVPALNADHAAAGSWHARPRTVDYRDSTARIDALDFYGYWKWLDGMIDTALYGENREFAFGNTPEQVFMGLWSDGTPVYPAEVLWP